MTARHLHNVLSRTTVAQILDAADVIVDEQGPAALTVAAVAERTGRPRSIVWQYFPDPAALAKGLVDRDRGTYAYRLKAAGLAPNVVRHLLGSDTPTVIALASALDRCNRESAWDAPVGYLPARGA